MTRDETSQLTLSTLRILHKWGTDHCPAWNPGLFLWRPGWRASLLPEIPLPPRYPTKLSKLIPVLYSLWTLYFPCLWWKPRGWYSAWVPLLYLLTWTCVLLSGGWLLRGRTINLQWLRYCSHWCLHLATAKSSEKFADCFPCPRLPGFLHLPHEAHTVAKPQCLPTGLILICPQFTECPHGYSW
jgi:hypothetical protein